jgi:RNA polymerase sigma factor for flagellar operon FliA
MPSCIEFEDLVSWGIEGLVKARQAYTPDKGAQFKTYAYIKVRGAILDRIRREWEYRNPSQFLEKKANRIKRLQTAIQSFPVDGAQNKSEAVDTLIEDSMTAYMVSLDPQLIDFELKSEQAEDPEIQFVDRSETVLWDEVKHLLIEEQQFVRLFYVVGLSQTEIAQKLNLSKSKISRLHKGIIKKLKRRLKSKYNEYG